MKNTTQIRDEIMDALLPSVSFDGWTLEAARRAAQESGYAPDMIEAVFPGGMDEIVAYFAERADRGMLVSLPEADGLKVREKIALAARKRLEWLNNHKEAEREAVAYWMRPLRKYKGARIVWRTADQIWVWAGDTATDYNRYTKRLLLSGVLTSTTVYWMQTEGSSLADTYAFLDRRIDNVLKLGKVIGSFKKARS